MTDQSSNRNRILIVEDDIKNQKILQALCKKLGYETDVADNGQVALDMIGDNPYLIYIVDLMMPVMDGKVFIGHLTAKLPDSVILVQTALDTTDTIIDIMKLGVFDYIIKPIDISLFQKTFQKAVEYKELKISEENKLKSFREELALVREIQASLKPDFNNVSGFDIAYAILPAEELSGDFLDGFSTGNNLHQIVLCDVSGHGIVSSYIGAEIKRIFRMITDESFNPAHVLSQVNNIISQDFKNSRYLSTVALCYLDSKNGTVRYASGGHPPAFLYCHNEDNCKPILPKGPIVGFIPEMKYEDLTIDMKMHDCLLIYSDGITEAFTETGDAMYEEERLLDVFTENTDKPSIDIIYSILDSVYRFSNYSRQMDDITIMCVKKT